MLRLASSRRAAQPPPPPAPGNGGDVPVERAANARKRAAVDIGAHCKKKWPKLHMRLAKKRAIDWHKPSVFTPEKCAKYPGILIRMKRGEGVFS